MKRTTPLFLTALCLAAAPLAAQEKRALTPADFDQWRSVSAPALSRTGEWVAYSLVPQVGDGEVVVRRAAGGAEFRHSRGYVGRPQTRAGATGPGSGYQPGRAQFSADARVLVFSVEQPKSEWDRARRERRKPADMPRPGLAIMSLPGGTVTRVARVRSFRMPEEEGRWLAYLMEPDSAAPRADSAAAAAPAAAATPGGTPRPVSTDTARGAKKKEYGSTLVLRDLHDGTETRIEDVSAYSFDRGGRWLGYTVSSRRAGADGAYVRALPGGRTHALLTGAGGYRGLTFSDDGRQAAFTTDRDSRSRDKPPLRALPRHPRRRRASARRAWWTRTRWAAGGWWPNGAASASPRTGRGGVRRHPRDPGLHPRPTRWRTRPSSTCGTTATRASSRSSAWRPRATATARGRPS
jgi:hypothetical protein